MPRFQRTLPCPASDIPCTHRCWMRRACESDPEMVRALMERVDREIAEAFERIANNQ